MNKEKKDLKPIWLYISIYIGIQLIIGFVLGAIYMDKAIDMIYKLTGLITLVTFLIIAIVFTIIYHNELKEKIKSISKNDIICIILGSIILIGLNELISSLLINANVEMKNQQTIMETYEQSKLAMTIAVILLAPFIEEIVFRYSLSTIFKNDYIFIIISSLIFGLMHGVGASSIVYIVMGVILSLIYVKTNKNIIAPIIAHILNNAFAIITMLIIIK